MTCAWCRRLPRRRASIGGNEGEPIPHVHEGSEVYPAPPDRPEWVAALGWDDEVTHA